MYWSRGHTIGRGASAATVSTATSLLSGDTFAVKSVKLAQSESIRREEKFLSSLDCPEIIGYKGCDITLENGIYMFNLMMEYAPSGTLADEIRRRGGRLDEPMIGYYTWQILKGLGYLHSRGIVHCDIKGSNVLMVGGECKIADFGCAKAVEEAVIGGTPMFMAPEVARGEEQGFSADIWALGCTVIEMFTGKSPWCNTASVLHRIAFSGEGPDFPASLSELGKDFLNKCFRVDRKQRWTAQELLKHPFLNEFRTDKTDSPTSILDRGIWSSTEEELSEYSSEVNDGEFLRSTVVQRMKELEMECGRENWEWTDSWVTVRDSKNVNISGKFREESRNLSLKRFTEELMPDEFQFL